MSEFSDFCCRIYDRGNNYNANLAKPPLSSAMFYQIGNKYEMQIVRQRYVKFYW